MKKYCFLASLLFCNFITASVSCAEGSIRMRPKDGEDVDASTCHLLQVCLFGQWNYVCNFQFTGIDLNVALHQLGYTGGACHTHNGEKLHPALISRVKCVGVERRLFDCPINHALSNSTCVPVEISVNNDTLDSCENGELLQTNVILQICVNGDWRSLCPSLWGPAQATVACRQLNPGRTVIGVAKSIDLGMSFSPHFRNPLFCKGNEKHITDCIVYGHEVDDDLCNDDKVVTSLMCQTGPAQLTLRAVSNGSVKVNWTQPVSVPTVLPQYRINYNITCTSSHGVHTTTSQHVTTPAVNESTHIHMTISGLTSNTSYNCCVSAHSELGTSESVCDTVITTEMMSNVPTQKVESSPASWVGGIIIGAVLSTVILLTVLAAVCLWRRKRSHSQHNTSVMSERERTASSSHTNDIYNAAYSRTSPQPYEECQLKQSTEPEYLYATPHTTSTLQQQSNSNVMELPVVDNTVLYSMCEEDVQEKKEYMYSEINRK